jgi:hypothetical protein
MHRGFSCELFQNGFKVVILIVLILRLFNLDHQLIGFLGIYISTVAAQQPNDP